MQDFVHQQYHLVSGCSVKLSLKGTEGRQTLNKQRQDVRFACIIGQIRNMDKQKVHVHTAASADA